MFFQLNDNPDAADVGDFFDVSGTGNDLIIHVQDETGVASFTVADASVISGGNFVRWTVPAAVETVLVRILNGDRFLLAFTRASVT